MTQFYRFRPDRLGTVANGSMRRNRVTDYTASVCAEGDVIVKVVGKVVRKPAEKKAKPFEVGKIYMMNGGRIKILAISGEHLFGRAPDAGNANFWCCMFTKTGQLVGADPKFTLVPEYEEVPGGLTIEEIKE